MGFLVDVGVFFVAYSCRGLKMSVFSVLKTWCYVHPHLIVWIF